MVKLMLRTLLLALGLLSLVPTLQGQYFGQNKPRYTNFDFKVYKSPHFEYYMYMKDTDARNRLIQWTEQWYTLHSRILRDSFVSQSPLLFYNNHADFQQTNAISGSVGVGTGGVTEGFKNRVVMPVAMSNQQTFHVLGHELVHAFQFHMLFTGDSTGLESLSNLPLWIVEGMAEYLSEGRIDPHTAMWMRDAVKNDDVPSLTTMSRDLRYNPYQYGQAFWSFLTGYYGDKVIEPLFTATAKFGIERAVQLVLGMSLDELSSAWEENIQEYYEPLKDSLDEIRPGKKIFSADNFGNANTSPILSPNGQYMVFTSEKSLFTTDLYLHDFRAKKTTKIVSQNRLANTDFINYLESSGTFSPDSKRYAFVTFKKGKNNLVIVDVNSKKILDEFTLRNVPAFANPNWSPDGKTIVVNGLVQGQSDLYAVNIRSKSVSQLTDDVYAEIQPAFSRDGSKIAFATDRISMDNGRTHAAWKHNLAILDVAGGTIENLTFFDGANNLNPTWDENDNIYFLSDRDGFRNAYKYNYNSAEITQLTKVFTGVSGITKYSPALSVNEKGTKIVYTHYDNFRYNIYQGRADDFLNIPVDPDDVHFEAAKLPPGEFDEDDVVYQALDRLDGMSLLNPDNIKRGKYRPQFKLDYISGGGGVGVGVGGINNFGTRTGLVGGVFAIFSDILGNNQIFTTASLNGEIYDFGAQVQFLNVKKRVAWGGSISHVPIRFGGQAPLSEEILETNFGNIPVVNAPIILNRIFIDRANFLSQLPFSKTTRLEGSAGFTRYSSRADQYNRYFDVNGFFIGQDQENIEKPFDGFNLYNANIALVGDKSQGLISPYQGYRYRAQIGRNVGEYTYNEILLDARKYFWFNRFNVSFRALHYGRYGGDADQADFFGYLYSIDPTLVRGYNITSLQELDELYGLELNQLRGSKIAVGNAEIRIPLSGPKRLALIKSGFLFSDLNFFLDGGIAWFENQAFYNTVDDSGMSTTLSKEFLMSTGVSIRAFVLGALVIEPYFAKPLRAGADWNFGVNFIPGW